MIVDTQLYNFKSIQYVKKDSDNTDGNRKLSI